MLYMHSSVRLQLCEFLEHGNGNKYLQVLLIEHIETVSMTMQLYSSVTVAPTSCIYMSWVDSQQLLLYVFPLKLMTCNLIIHAYTVEPPLMDLRNSKNLRYNGPKVKHRLNFLLDYSEVS